MQSQDQIHPVPIIVESRKPLIRIDQVTPFANIIGTSDAARNWFRYHELLAQASDHDINEKYLKMQLAMMAQCQRSDIPEVKWISSAQVPAIFEITNSREFTLPIVEFDEAKRDLFYRILKMDPQQYLCFGACMSTPSELVIPALQPIVNPSVIVLQSSGNSDYKQSPVTYNEARNHEVVHGMDPKRGLDKLVRDEIVALIGSFADPANKYNTITIHPSHLISYVIEESAFKGRPITQPEAEKIVHDIIFYTNQLNALRTQGGQRITNDEMTRLLIGCHTLNEVIQLIASNASASRVDAKVIARKPFH